MTPTLPADPPASLVAAPTVVDPARLRRLFGLLRLGMGLLLLASISTQVVDNVLHGSFVPTEYFTFFTIQSTLINAVVLLVGGVLALRWSWDSPLLANARMATVSYAVVTGVVYGALLRGIPSEGYAGIPWPNEVLHVWAPIFIALDWLLAPGRTRLAWSSLWLAVLYPVAWLSFTLVRGAVDGWYPYPFLDPHAPAGWGGVLVHILGIAVLIVAVAATAIGTGRLTARLRP